MIHSRHEGQGERGSAQVVQFEWGGSGKGKGTHQINLLRHTKKNNSINHIINEAYKSTRKSTRTQACFSFLASLSAEKSTSTGPPWRCDVCRQICTCPSACSTTLLHEYTPILLQGNQACFLSSCIYHVLATLHIDISRWACSFVLRMNQTSTTAAEMMRNITTTEYSSHPWSSSSRAGILLSSIGGSVDRGEIEGLYLINNPRISCQGHIKEAVW